MLKRLVTVVCACVAMLATADVRGQSAIEQGKPFPEIVLPLMGDSSPASVAMFRGKKTVLHIFASW